MAEKNVSVRLSANTTQFQAQMAAAGAASAKMAATSQASFAAMGTKMQTAGRAMSLGLTAPLAAAGVAAVKMSMGFETAFSRMVGLAGVAAEDVDGLKESVLALAGTTGQAPVDLANALYEAASAGLTSAQAMDAVDVAARAAAAGMGSAQDVVGLIASATASYGADVMDAATATDILTQTIREGRADPEELAGSLGRILPIAAQMGVSFAEVGGVVAYATNAFGDTDRAVTGVNDALAKLSAPGESAKTILREMGTSADELKAAISQDGLMGGLQLLRDHGFAGNSEAIRQLMPDMQGAATLTLLLNDATGTLDDTIGNVTDSTGAMGDAFATASETQGFKMKQAMADIQVALIQVGDIIGPIVADIAGAVADIAGAFSKLPAPVQKAIVGFAGVAAAVGPLLVVGGSLVKNFGLITTAVSKVSTGLGGLPVSIGGVTAVIGAASLVYGRYAREKEEAAAVTDTFTAALLAEAAGQRGASEEAILAMLRTGDALDVMENYGLSHQQLADYIRGESVPAVEEFFREVSELPSRTPAAQLAGDLKTARDAMEDAAPAARRVATEAFSMGAAMGLAGEEAVAATDEMTAGFEGAEMAARGLAGLGDGLRSMGSALFGGMEGAAQGIGKTVEQLEAMDEAANNYATTVAGLDWGRAALDGATTAMTTFNDQHFGLARILSTNEGAVDALAESFKNADGHIVNAGASFDLTTEAGRQQQAALEGVAAALETKFVAAYDDANGSLEAFKTAGAGIREDFVAMAAAAGIPAEAAEDLADALGLTEGDYEARFELSGAAEAQLKLELLSGMLDVLSEDAQEEIALKIATGDFEGGLALATQGLQELDAQKAEPEIAAPTAPGVRRLLDDVTAAAGRIPEDEETDVSAPGARPTRALLDEVTSAADRVPERESVSVSAPGAGSSTGALNGVAGAARGIPGSRNTNVSTSGTGSAIAAIAGVRGALAGLNNRTVFVDVVVRGAGGAGMGLFADGGTVGPGGGIAGEAGLERLSYRGRTAYVNQPTFVPPGTVVTPMRDGGSVAGGGLTFNVEQHITVGSKDDIPLLKHQMRRAVSDMIGESYR